MNEVNNMMKELTYGGSQIFSIKIMNSLKTGIQKITRKSRVAIAKFPELDS